MKKRNVLLILDLFNPLETRSSTQFINYSLIDAVSKNEDDVFVIGVYDKRSNKNKISLFLNKLGINHCLLPSQVNSVENKPIKNYILNSFYSLFPHRTISKDLVLPFKSIDRMIVSVPSVECACIGMAIKKKFQTMKTIAIWTDVIAYNCIDSSKKIPLKRKMFIGMEKKIIKNYDASYYLGKTQMEFQKEAFKKFASRMKYYYPSYYPYYDTKYWQALLLKQEKYSLLYFGYLGDSLRNIKPLCECSKEFSDVVFKIIGTRCNSIKSFAKDNLEIQILDKRIDKIEEVLEIEAGSKISVCYLNKHGFSLPGKMFYYSNLNRPILVIRDGPFQDKITEELSIFNRFVFCDNTPSSIKSAINTIINSKKTFTEKESLISPYDCYYDILNN